MAQHSTDYPKNNSEKNSEKIYRKTPESAAENTLAYKEQSAIPVNAQPASQQQISIHQQLLEQSVFLFWDSCFAAFSYYRRWLAPLISKSTRMVRREMIIIHHKQNWFKRCGVTLFDNATGLGIAMLAAKFVQDQVEVQQFSNLWGLLATRPVVSESTYEIISFGVEFIIALIVFTLTEHYMEEFRQRRKNTQSKAVEIPEVRITGN